MHNVATIYRFNTPFLDLRKEKEGLLSVIRKIEKSVEFDWIQFDKIINKDWNYYIVKLKFTQNLWEICFYYIKDVWKKIYHLPIFKLNIFINNSFLVDNSSKTKAVKFLNNIFECFDWLNEKEYLIDLDNTFYYKSWLFFTKKYPSHDFSDIEKIRENFEWKDWMNLLKQFIVKYKNKNFILTRENSNEYHKLHWILLYFIYLVFIMSQNIEKIDIVKANIKSNNNNNEWIYESHVDLMKKRLNYVDDLNKAIFEKYKNRLELFFKMF